MRQCFRSELIDMIAQRIVWRRCNKYRLLQLLSRWLNDNQRDTECSAPSVTACFSLDSISPSLFAVLRMATTQCTRSFRPRREQLCFQCNRNITVVWLLFLLVHRQLQPQKTTRSVMGKQICRTTARHQNSKRFVEVSTGRYFCSTDATSESYIPT